MVTYKTPLESLESCLQLWEVIVEHNLQMKEEAYEKLGISADRDTLRCPACEFTAAAGSRLVDCSVCPIWKGNGDFKCESEFNSPYRDWRNAWDNLDERSEAAKSMVELIRVRIVEVK